MSLHLEKCLSANEALSVLYAGFGASFSFQGLDSPSHSNAAGGSGNETHLCRRLYFHFLLSHKQKRSKKGENTKLNLYPWFGPI